MVKESNLVKNRVSLALLGKDKPKQTIVAITNIVFKFGYKLNYQSNLFAGSCFSGETNIIGFLPSPISNNLNNEVVCVGEAIVEEQEYFLMINRSESIIIQEDETIKLFKSKRISEMIVPPTKLSKVETQRLLYNTDSLGVIDRYFPKPEADHIIYKDRNYSSKLTKYNENRGCGKIVLLTKDSNFEFVSIQEPPVLNNLTTRGNISRMTIDGIGKESAKEVIYHIELLMHNKKSRNRKIPKKCLIHAYSQDFRS